MFIYDKLCLNVKITMHTKFYHLVFCFVLFLIFSKIQIAVQFLSVNFFLSLEPELMK